MRKAIGLCILLLVVGSASFTQSRYFPPDSLASDPKIEKLIYDWYSKQLKAMKEPSLWELSRTQSNPSYRFIWLRSFHHPMVLRVDINADGSSLLTTKIGSGNGGYKPGHLSENKSTKLSKAQTDKFLSLIEKQNFWNFPPTDRSPRGEDGAQWIIEGVKNGNYHFIDRWSPSDGPAWSIGFYMQTQLAKLDIPVRELY